MTVVTAGERSDSSLGPVGDLQSGQAVSCRSAEFRSYNPHGSVRPRDAPPGSMFRVEAVHTVLGWYGSEDMPVVQLDPIPLSVLIG